MEKEEECLNCHGRGKVPFLKGFYNCSFCLKKGRGTKTFFEENIWAFINATNEEKEAILFS